MKREMIENVLKGLDIKDEDTIKKIVDSVMVEYGKAFKEKGSW